jgi:hypothetical protein
MKEFDISCGQRCQVGIWLWPETTLGFGRPVLEGLKKLTTSVRMAILLAEIFTRYLFNMKQVCSGGLKGM